MGTTLCAGSPRVKHGPGSRFGQLEIVKRVGTVNRTGRVLVRCDCGNTVERSLPNLISGKTVNCADRAHHPDPRRKAEGLTYSGAHTRVRTVRGPASAHACVRCGEPAADWAYSNADLAPLRDEAGREAGLPFSADPEHYLPMCRRCHRAFDIGHRSVVGTSGAISLAHVGAWHLWRMRGRELTCR